MSQLNEFEETMIQHPSFFSEEFIQVYFALKSARLIDNKPAIPSPPQLRNLSLSEYQTFFDETIENIKNGLFFDNSELVSIEDVDTYTILRKRGDSSLDSKEPFIFTFFNKLYNVTTERFHSLFYHGDVKITSQALNGFSINHESKINFNYNGIQKMIYNDEIIANYVANHFRTYLMNAVAIQYVTEPNQTHSKLEKRVLTPTHLIN